ncbi:MAG: hypothetical protein UX72_C0009G0005 [Parcubacteria group bacterium GW2011_GWA2_47_10]|nr:MAG: hypothetical protein UX72_C0009G0005 [Parcubacteria group bacterium GW2011_GWA2_47_10]
MRDEADSHVHFYPLVLPSKQYISNSGYFMEQKAPPRIVGLETEYAFTPITDGKFINDSWGFPLFFLRLFPSSYLCTSNDLFLYNGARVYIDTGGHPEYATPECQDVGTLIRYDKAGERMMERAERFMNQCFLPFENQKLLEWILEFHKFASARDRLRWWFESKNYPVRIYRNNIAINTVSGSKIEGPVSWGFHESYSVPAKIPWNRLETVLLPFLSTRQIYGGAGWFGQSDGVMEFWMSQRASVMYLNSNHQTVSNRSVLNTKNEPLSDKDVYRRLHLIMGDSNMSPWATWLKVKATCIVLDMLEDEAFLAGINFNYDNAAGIMRMVARDISFNRTFQFGGRTHTALSVQRFFLDLAKRFYFGEERIEADEETREALALWEFALDRIYALDISVLSPYFDNFAKIHIAEAMLHKRGIETPRYPGFLRSFRVNSETATRLKGFDLSYHRVLSEESSFMAFQKSRSCRALKEQAERTLPFLARDLVPAEAIEHCWWNPPPGRATWRYSLIKAAEAYQALRSVQYISLYWDKGSLVDMNTIPIATFSNDDPHRESTEELTEFIEKMSDPPASSV